DVSHYLSRLVAARCCHLQAACRTEIIYARTTANVSHKSVISLLFYLERVNNS
ncbi:unnamed protein product, partial [Porites lobata]